MSIIVVKIKLRGMVPTYLLVTPGTLDIELGASQPAELGAAKTIDGFKSDTITKVKNAARGFRIGLIF
jgi:hypothetical protein